MNVPIDFNYFHFNNWPSTMLEHLSYLICNNGTSVKRLFFVIQSSFLPSVCPFSSFIKWEINLVRCRFGIFPLLKHVWSFSSLKFHRKILFIERRKFQIKCNPCGIFLLLSRFGLTYQLFRIPTPPSTFTSNNWLVILFFPFKCAACHSKISRNNAPLEIKKENNSSEIEHDGR